MNDSRWLGVERGCALVLEGQVKPAAKPPKEAVVVENSGTRTPLPPPDPVLDKLMKNLS